MAVRQWVDFITTIFVAFSGALTEELMCMCRHAQTEYRYLNFPMKKSYDWMLCCNHASTLQYISSPCILCRFWNRHAILIFMWCGDTCNVGTILILLVCFITILLKILNRIATWNACSLPTNGSFNKVWILNWDWMHELSSIENEWALWVECVECCALWFCRVRDVSGSNTLGVPR